MAKGRERIRAVPRETQADFLSALVQPFTVVLKETLAAPLRVVLTKLVVFVGPDLMAPGGLTACEREPKVLSRKDKGERFCKDTGGVPAKT